MSTYFKSQRDIIDYIVEQLRKNNLLLKSEDGLTIAASILEKARKKVWDEHDPNSMDDDGDIDPDLEGLREFNPDDESSGEDWLKDNDPKYKNEYDDEYDEYSPDEDEESHQSGIEEDLGQDHDVVKPQVPQKTNRESPIDQNDSQEEVSGKSGRFRQPSQEELASLRAYTRPWEQRARDTQKLKADPSKNPVLAHAGGLIEAREKHHADRRKAYTTMISSNDYKNTDPISQMEMDDNFEKDWHAKNPEHLMNAYHAHHEAHQKEAEYGGRVGEKGQGVFDSAKDAKITNILQGGAHSPESFSLEEGLQHAGGIRGEEGTEGTITHDPASSFAMGNQDFIKQYAKDYENKGKKPKNIDEMMDYDEGSKRDISRILGPAQEKDHNFEKFFSHYYPLIGMSANKTIKRLGLDPKNPDIDMSMLHEAGMHGLIQAMNDYDHSNPGKASFSTHAGHKIRGLQMTAMKNQDQIPAEVRQAQKKFAAQGRTKTMLSTSKHPEVHNITDRLNRIDTHKQTQAIRRTGAAAQPKPITQPINIPKFDDNIGEE